ncbi:MAG TPA: hypothetical protein DIV86_03640 [Alphaproteobacteria bacterium]|nr:hypothetical protein [Alphaproteobacteria bacterium]
MTSTMQIYRQTIADFKSLQGVLYSGQSKIGADSKATTFAELGTELPIIQGFYASAQRADRFINSIEQAQRRLDTSYRALDEIIEAAISFKSDLALENSPNSNINDLSGSANTKLDIITGALNSRDGNIFVFGGSKTNEIPVADLKRLNNNVNGEVTANYYNGDNFKSEVDISKSLRVQYGVNADNEAFRNVISALNLAKDAEAGGVGALELAGLTLDTAIDQLINLRSSMGNNSKVFQTTLEVQISAKTTFEQKYAEANEPDIVQLTIETGQAQTALTALFQNFARISGLSLVNYL